MAIRLLKFLARGDILQDGLHMESHGQDTCPAKQTGIPGRWSHQNLARDKGIHPWDKFHDLLRIRAGKADRSESDLSGLIKTAQSLIQSLQNF